MSPSINCSSTELRRQLQRDVTLSTTCGSSDHEVIYRVTAWGHVFPLFSPCDHLPHGVRNLTAANCQSLVSVVQESLQDIAIPAYADTLMDTTGKKALELDPCGDLNRFIMEIRETKVELAKQLLISTDVDAYSQLVTNGDTAQRWAVSVIALGWEKLPLKLLASVRYLCQTTNCVTRAMAILALRNVKRAVYRDLVLQSLLDPRVALIVRDEVARSLAGINCQEPLDLIVLDVLSRGTVPTVIDWTELRQQSLPSAYIERIVQVRSSILGSRF